MASSKALWRCKWFNCFKIDVEPFHTKGFGGSDLKNNIHHKFLMDLSVDDDKFGLPFDSKDDGRRSKRKKFRRGFSRVMKGILVPTSFTNKTRSKKSGEETSKKDPSFKIHKTFKFKKSPPPGDPAGAGEISPLEGSLGHSTNTSVFSSTVVSSSSSSPLISSRSTSERKPSDLTTDYNIIRPLKNNKSISIKKNHGAHNGNLGLYFLLICLLGLVFCGKAFAIFCTATCLFLIPTRRKVNGIDSPLDFDSDMEHKKKVIVEGLRQRSAL